MGRVEAPARWRERTQGQFAKKPGGTKKPDKQVSLFGDAHHQKEDQSLFDQVSSAVAKVYRDEEDFLSQSGASRQDIGDPALHRQPRSTEKSRKKNADRQAQKDADLLAKRGELRKEFEEKKKSGEIRTMGGREKLMDTASGHPDNEATQAARRLLKKRFGYDWDKENGSDNEGSEAGSISKEWEKLAAEYNELGEKRGTAVNPDGSEVSGLALKKLRSELKKLKGQIERQKTDAEWYDDPRQMAVADGKMYRRGPAPGGGYQWSDQINTYSPSIPDDKMREMVQSGKAERMDHKAAIDWAKSEMERVKPGSTASGPNPPSEEGPKEGDTKTKNGRTYVLRGGRWHRADQDPEKQKPETDDNADALQWDEFLDEHFGGSLDDAEEMMEEWDIVDRAEFMDFVKHPNGVGADGTGNRNQTDVGDVGGGEKPATQDDDKTDTNRKSVEPEGKETAKASSETLEPEGKEKTEQQKQNEYDKKSSEGNPREAAAHYYDLQQKDDYAWARKSKIGNVGRDIEGSARHKRNRLREMSDLDGLTEDEASKALTRAKLMRENPLNMAVHAERNADVALSMHLAMQAFPSKPFGSSDQESWRDSARKPTRRIYMHVFNEMRDTAENLARSENDPAEALQKFSDAADKLRDWLDTDAAREMAGEGYAGYTMRTKLRKLSNATRMKTYSGGLYQMKPRVARRDKHAPRAKIELMMHYGKEAHGDGFADSGDYYDRVLDVIEGKSIPKAFDKSKANQDPVKLTEIYGLQKEKRKGGRMVRTTTGQKSQKVLKDIGVADIQYGNSMPDDEREHHTARAAEAFVDLADVLGVPDKSIGAGKLGLAFGARGRAGMLAHFEPSQNVINMTRANGAGSLAHEWAHFADWNHEESFGYSSGDHSATGSTKLHKDVQQTWEKAKERITEAVRKQYSYLQHEARWKKIKYWTSDVEMFARFTERLVQKRLHDQGRDNGYLVGLSKETHPFWPTDEELGKSEAAMQAIYDDYSQRWESKHGTVERTDRYSRIQAMTDELRSRLNASAAS